MYNCGTMEADLLESATGKVQTKFPQVQENWLTKKANKTGLSKQEILRNLVAKEMENEALEDKIKSGK